VNTNQKCLSVCAFTALSLSIVIIPWQVDVGFLDFPVLSGTRYGLIWSPPFGGVNPSWVGIFSSHRSVNICVIVVEWLVLAVAYLGLFKWFGDPITR